MFPLHFFRVLAASIGFQHFPLPAPLEKLTTRPRALLTSGRNVLVISINPHRFTSAVLLYMVSGVHSIGSLCTIPALFTRPHSLPKNYIFKSCHPSNSVAKTECPEWKGMVQFPSPILFYFGPQCAMLQTFVPITIPVPCFKYTLITQSTFYLFEKNC